MTTGIFKADLLANKIPDLATIIDCNDYIHVAYMYDDRSRCNVFVSYVWDTRHITNTAQIYDDTNYAVDAFKALSDDDCKLLLANDNHTRLQIVTDDAICCQSYVQDINDTMMIRPIFMHLDSKSDISNKITTFVLDGQDICTVTKFYNGAIKQNDIITDWHADAITALFGKLPKQLFYYSFCTTCIDTTLDMVKATLLRHFNIVFI